jgi:hypothetical protein
MAYNVFVLGLDQTNLDMLKRLPAAERYRFRTLLHHDELRGVEGFYLTDLIASADERLRAIGGAVDAVVTLLDFPATELVPILAKRARARSPSLEAVLRCSHKYWSRLVQREVVPECVPAFAVFDPAVEDVARHVDLPSPFWVKPLNAYRSHLSFRIGSREDFDAALPLLRDELPRLAEPLKVLMQEAAVPDGIAGLGPGICIAEGLIRGRQCTLEGYVQGGRARVYGVVDSIRDRNRISFARYQYPSTLPRRVRERMTDVAVRVMEHLGYDDGCFNIELFWDRRRDRIWLLEINPRLSQSHCELFEKVDGASNAQVMLDVALGHSPDPPRGRGEAAVAAKFFIRAFRDGIVTRAPTPDDVARAEAAVPGAHVSVHVEPGVLLSDLPDQDSYSYELATVRLGAANERELLQRHRKVTAELPFAVEVSDR